MESMVGRVLVLQAAYLGSTHGIPHGPQSLTEEPGVNTKHHEVWSNIPRGS